MADRTVSVRLVADAQAYIRGVEEASRKTRESTQTIEQQLARQRQAYQEVGRAMAVVGGAIVATGVAAMNTGIQYNTLQQTTRTALETILGSAEAANEQMDRLDDFARNSPFAKQVFIEAQQQLLAFGMEAERVVPTLDAIQNAVAATGGSNQDIAELVRIIAQLEGGVRISAETFNQFGVRGIDAAQLIGDAMGKTGQQIRQEVTAGTLDADAAIQALTDGMQARFAGAADGVKDTFDGAMDRVKAAWRDLASELARPLVDPDGGGALIDLMNGLADLLRWFEALPEPIRNTVTGLGLATGAILLLGGTAMLAVPKVTELTFAMDTLGIRGGSFVRGALGRTANFLTGPWGIAIAAAAVGLGVLNQALSDAHANATQFGNVLNTDANPNSIIALLNDGQFARGALEDLENVQILIRQLESGLANALNAPFGNLSDLNRFKDSLGELDTAMSSLSLERATAMFDEFGQALEMTPEQIEAMLRQMPRFEAQLYGVADALGINLEEMQEWERQLWLAEAATGGFRDANGELVDASHLATDAASGAVEVLDEQTLAAENAAAALDLLAEAIREISSDYITSQDALQAYGDQIRRASEDVLELSGVTLNAAGDIDVLTESGSDAHNLLRDFATQARDTASSMLELDGDVEGANDTLMDARTRFIELLEQMGITGREAEILADRYGLTEDAVLTLSDAIQNIPDGHAEIDVDTVLAHQAIDDFIARNTGRQIILGVNVDGTERVIHPGQRGLYAAGGRIPGYAPGYDDRFGFLRDGSVVGLGGGEYIMPTLMTDRYLPILEQMRQGTFPGYADGGRVAAPVYNSSSAYSSVNNITLHMTVEAAAGMDANAVASLASNRAVSRVAEVLGRA